MATITNDEYHDTSPQNIKLKTGNCKILLLLDSGSACFIVWKDKAISIIETCYDAKCLTDKGEIKDFLKRTDDHFGYTISTSPM